MRIGVRITQFLPSSSPGTLCFETNFHTVGPTENVTVMGLRATNETGLMGKNGDKPQIVDYVSKTIENKKCGRRVRPTHGILLSASNDTGTALAQDGSD